MDDDNKETLEGLTKEEDQEEAIKEALNEVRT